MEDAEELHPAVQGLKTVCQCNNIKYRTIERAIREGARTLAAVAVKTTATTGHCGGTCTPDIQQMLSEIAPHPAGACPEQSRRGHPLAAAAGRGAGGEGQWWVKK
jgi:NAD(P)H-nitrite reductase large subunit